MKILKFLAKPLLIILVLISALWLIAFLSKEPTSPQSWLKLSPEKGKFKVGQEFAVKIILRTNEEINGADAILSFDPNLLEVRTIKEGQAFPLYPRKNIDLKGRLEITGVKLRKDGQVFTGPQVFAIIVFGGKKRGIAKVNFVFYKGKTTGSSIIKAQGSVNILEKVYNGNYNITDFDKR